MKLLKKLIVPLLVLCLILTSCGGKGSSADSSGSSGQSSSESSASDSSGTDSSSTDSSSTDSSSTDSSGTDSSSTDSSSTDSSGPDESGEEVSPAEISEKAMESFLSKVDEGNYTINAEGVLKASVPSKDQVVFDYTDETYNDFAVMSVNNEVFQALLAEDRLGKASFLGEGHAVDFAKSRLLMSYWMADEVSQGNIYNLFYNSPDEPLTFVSYDDTVKQSVLSFAGYGEMAFSAMQEVYLVMDSEDPAEVHLTAVMEDNPVTRISYDDIDIAVTFGDAETDPAADAWMSSPVYPEARTEWTDEDIFILNSVFLAGYGEEAVPFPTFASYALKLDEENFVIDDEVNMRDSHATEEDMAKYEKTLLDSGFAAVDETAADGTARKVYRRMLREEYKCYSSIELAYDNGVNLTARKYYDFPVYDSLEAINEKIGEFGFAALPDTLAYESVKGTDTANEATESWLYFFDYNTVMYVDFEYKDEEKIKPYLSEYGAALETAGFHAAYVDDTEELDRYVSEDGSSSFRYHIEDGVLSLLFKSEKHIPASEVEGLLKEAGFPEIDLPDDVSCRDLRKFEKAQYGRDVKAYITVSQTFATTQEAEEFLSKYEEVLTDAGYGRVSPDTVGSTKPIAIYNEDTGMLVAIDFIEEGDGAFVNYDFRAE